MDNKKEPKQKIVYRKTRKDKGKKKKEAILYECDICIFTTMIKRALTSHVLSAHATRQQRKEKYPFYCDECDFGSFDEKNLNKHKLTKKCKFAHERANEIRKAIEEKLVNKKE